MTIKGPLSFQTNRWLALACSVEPSPGPSQRANTPRRPSPLSVLNSGKNADDGRSGIVSVDSVPTYSHRR